MYKLMTSIMCSLIISGCTNTGNRIVPLVKEALPKTVMITITAVIEVASINVDGNNITIKLSTMTAQYYGAGVYISPVGHIVTCNHLLSHGSVKDVIVTQYDGTMMKADILYWESNKDLALIKVNAVSLYAKIANPKNLKVGQEVFAIGNPLGLNFSVSHGIVSALNRDGSKSYNLTQSDVFINPGNSGGPLFNFSGELIGINSRIISPTNAPIFTGISCSIPTEQLLEFLDRFRGLEKALYLPYWDRVWNTLVLGK